MAKGDDERSRNKIDFEGDRSRQLGENLRTGTLMPQLQQFRDYYSQAAPQQMGDYSNLMGGFQNFAQTGGFSGQDLSNIRARAVGPSRSIYAGANRDVDRQRSLQGGYSPGYGVLKARLAREGSQALSDANTNVEASIAQMVQQGKLAGLQGGTSLYGTTPGMTSTFGNQVLGATDQLSTATGREMALGPTLAGLQIQASQLPGKWESTVGRINDVFDIAKNAAEVYAGSKGAGGYKPNPGDS